jgi:hypothetical protein
MSSRFAATTKEYRGDGKERAEYQGTSGGSVPQSDAAVARGIR